MDDPFSPQARRLVEAAEEIARSLPQEFQAHAFVLAYVRQLDVETTEAISIPVTTWHTLAQVLHPASKVEPSPDSFQWSADAHAIFARAKEIAWTFSRFRTVESTDLVVATMEQSEPIRKHLQDIGVDTDRWLEDFHARRQPLKIEIPAELDWSSEEHPDSSDLFRILDANLNRAREGLRTLEEHARFVLEDVELTTRLKTLRHELASIEMLLGATHLVSSRDSIEDVGAGRTSPSEQRRLSLDHVVSASAKRVQEALRVIEEYSKIRDPRASQSAKSIRYELYEVERILLAQRAAIHRLSHAQLYWLCDPSACERELEWMVHEALAGGVDIIQLRDKHRPDRQLLADAKRMAHWVREHGGIFIVNDRPDLARLAGADGVHVGQEELRVREARRIIGGDRLIGVSTHSIEQAEAATAEGAHYLGVGPLFSSSTKSFDQFVGIELVQQAKELSIPWFAIGGIDLDRARKVIDAGASRIAVGALLNRSAEPRSVASALKSMLLNAGATRPHSSSETIT